MIDCNHMDDRVMDDRGQMHIEARSHLESDSNLMTGRLKLKNPGCIGSPAQCASSRKAE